MAEFGAHSLTMSETKHLLSGLDDWVKPKSISTPIGIIFIISRIGNGLMLTSSLTFRIGFGRLSLELSYLYCYPSSCCSHFSRKLCDFKAKWMCTIYIKRSKKIIWHTYGQKFKFFNLGFYRVIEGKV